MLITGNYCSVKEATAKIGCSDAHVRHLLKQGVLVGQKISERAWVVSLESIEAFVGAQKTTGRPRKNNPNCS